ncbi:hypothetical protein [Sanguibacteroides justesenii]|nr:hypothetical protein [Sanguibacteroides justesenii]
MMCGTSASGFPRQVGYLFYVQVSDAAPPLCAGGRVLCLFI